MNKTYLTDDEYDFIYSRVPRICIDLLIRDSNGGILLTKRDSEPYKDYWHTPGGRVKFRETIKEAVKRIALIELNKSVEVGNMIGFVELLNEQQGNSQRHSITIYFECFSEGIEGNYFKQLPEKTIPEQLEFLKTIL